MSRTCCTRMVVAIGCRRVGDTDRDTLRSSVFGTVSSYVQSTVSVLSFVVLMWGEGRCRDGLWEKKRAVLFAFESLLLIYDIQLAFSSTISALGEIMGKQRETQEGLETET